MMRYLLILLFLNLAFFEFAQNDSIIIQLKIVDETDQEPIQNVNIVFESYQNSTFFYKKFKKSNHQGLSFIQVNRAHDLLIKLNHVLYESQQFKLKSSDFLSKDTLFITKELRPIKKDLKEVVVKAPGVPDTVFSSKRLSVADFEVLQNGDMILLTYPKQLKKGSELLLYNGFETIANFNVPGMAKELVSDFRKNTHVVCENEVYGIHVTPDKIGISSIEKEYFFKYLMPILDSNYAKYYFTTFNKDYPAFDYFTYDLKDSSYRKICNIQDDLMMELYRAEYKWVDVRTKMWAKYKELETGIDAEVWVGANYFTQSIYYKELYAPMFSRNDSIFVFDYYKDELITYNQFGDEINRIAIFHHYKPKNTGWKNQLIQDKITGEIYALYDKAGYSLIGRVNVVNGEIENLMKLEFRYIDKIQIHDNFIYYVYRPFETPQKKFLYKERSIYNYSIKN